MAFIFGLSSQTAEESSTISGGVATQVVEVVKPGFSDMPTVEQNAVVEEWKIVVAKVGHVAEYAVLGVLAWITMGFHISPPWKRAGVAAGIGLLYAISDEVHQLFVLDRGASVWDVFIDLAGVCLGIALAVGIARWWHKRKTT